jgi:spore coat assembly protein SafA
MDPARYSERRKMQPTSSVSNNSSATAFQGSAPPGQTHTVERGDTLSDIAKANGVTVAALLAANPQIRNADMIYPGDEINIPESGNQTHTVERGDTLAKIAGANGVSVSDLMAANPQIRNPNLIYPGDKIKIPASTTSGTASGTPSSAVPSTPAGTGPTKAAIAANSAMTTSEAGKAIIRKSEGFIGKPYNDPAGHATIGYGHLLHLGNVTAADRAKWGTISEAEGRALLDKDIAKVEGEVKNLVKVPITQGQLDALTSFAFNLGSGALADSTLLRKLNAGDYAGAQKEFGRWVNATDANGNLVKLPGLVTRRAEEAKLFGSAGPTGAGGTPTTPPATTGGTLPGDGSVKPGAKGDGVKTLQDDLVKLGFMTRAQVNTGYGTFGPQTEAALKSFQSSVGISPTGSVGPQTKSALEAVIGGVGVNKNANSDVTNAVQKQLVAGKFLTAADAQAEAGVYGAKTEAAVKAFQAKNNIQQTGVVGPQTFGALQSAGGTNAGKNGYVYPLPAQYRTVNRADKAGEGEGEFHTGRSGGRLHKGIDIEAPVGTPVSAVKGGTATVLSQPSGAGLYVKVEHPDGTASLYFHLNTAKASIGQSFNVTAGQQIGTVGRSGNTPSAGDTHLHFEIRDANNNEVDPTPFFPQFR